MSRYAIQNAEGLLYSDNTVPETVYVPRAGNPREAEPRSMLAPVFGSVNAVLAIKYDTAADAEFLMTHPDLQDPQAFAGCSVVEVEHIPLDKGAVRPL